MLEKLKAFGESIKSVILYILGPLLAILGYVVYLRNQNTELKDQITASEAASHLAKTLEKKVEDEKQADVSETDYETLRDAYLKHDDSTSTDPSETKLPTDNQGS